MHTHELLEACLQALSSGQEIPTNIALYLTRHPEQRAQIEELLFAVQRASQLPAAELSATRRQKMQARLAERMGVSPALFAAQNMSSEQATAQQKSDNPAQATHCTRRGRLLAAGRASLARLRSTSPQPDEIAAARIRTAFRNLTPEDIRRYIGVRGEQYLYYRQRFPRWEPVFALIAALLRGFKRLEKLTNLYS